TGRYCAERVFDTINLLLPNRLAEPDGEPIDFQSAPPGCQKMPQFMHKNEQVKQQEHFQENENKFQNRHSLSLQNTPKILGVRRNIAANVPEAIVGNLRITNCQRP